MPANLALFTLVFLTFASSCDTKNIAVEKGADIDSEAPENESQEIAPLQFARRVDKIGDLACDDKRDGLLVYSKEERSFYICSAGEFESISLKGDKGERGEVGLVGAQGLKGDTGPAGADGPQGLQGLAGPTGPQGVTGPQGAAGVAGPQGATGAPSSLKVYDHEGDALFYFVSVVYFENSNHSPDGQSSQGLLVRSLTENKYTVYEVATISRNGDSSGYLRPGGMLTQLELSSAPRFTNSNCTGQGYLPIYGDVSFDRRISETFLGIPGLYFEYGNYEVRISSLQQVNTGSTFSHYMASNGTCVANAFAHGSGFPVIIDPSPQFPDTSIQGWYIAP